MACVLFFNLSLSICFSSKHGFYNTTHARNVETSLLLFIVNYRSVWCYVSKKKRKKEEEEVSPFYSNKVCLGLFISVLTLTVSLLIWPLGRTKIQVSGMLYEDRVSVKTWHYSHFHKVSLIANATPVLWQQPQYSQVWSWR